MRFEGLKYDSPNSFTFKQRVQLTVLPPLLASVFKILYRSNRVSDKNIGGRQVLAETHPRGILAMWHETCGLMGMYHLNSQFHTLTSYSFDGELAARLVRCFGMEAVRGSSSRGGFEALNQLEAALKHVPYVGITADGPRGPRRKSKPGSAMLSARTGLPIIPIAIVAEPCWRMKSWDRFAVPKPFGHIRFAYGNVIEAPTDNSRETIARVSKELDTALNSLHADLGDDSYQIPDEKRAESN